MRKRLEEVQVFIEAAKHVQKVGDEWNEKVREDLGDPSCDSCNNPGCCYQMTIATPAEGLMIAHYLDNLGMNTDRYRKKLMRQGEAVEQTNRDDWFLRAVPCVFLGDDKKCRIYPWRPVNCRTYAIWNEPINCLPQKLREKEHKNDIYVKSGDNTQIIALAIVLSQGIIVESGYDIDRPFIRSLPSMVSVMLEAVLATTPEQFWTIVTEQSSMDQSVFDRMIQEQM